MIRPKFLVVIHLRGPPTAHFLEAQELLEASITLESSLRDHKDGIFSGTVNHPKDGGQTDPQNWLLRASYRSVPEECLTKGFAGSHNSVTQVFRHFCIWVQPL